MPPYAYVPGKSPRHAGTAFDDLKSSVRPGMTSDELAATAAWRCGLKFLDAGYFWEAHELFEPVWLATPPNSSERHLVQAMIQVANAGLKDLMQRPRAVMRLCDLAQAHLDACSDGLIMGVGTDEITERIALLRRDANP